MRKEVILAVIIGIILGGVILYGINLANSTSKPDTEDQNTENDTQVNPTSPSNLQDQISITSPQKNAVVTEEKITLKGSTKPNLNIAIISENDDLLVISDENGGFSSEINLISGENLITVTAVNEKLATVSASITVIRTATLPN